MTVIITVFLRFLFDVCFTYFLLELTLHWISLAISSTVLFSIVAVLDKKLLARYIHDVRTFYFCVGAFQLIVSLIVILINPWESNPSTFTFFVGFSSGIVWALGLMTMFFGMSKLEVSRVIPISHTYPVFVAIMATYFLGETLSFMQYSSILLTVLGAGLLARSGVLSADTSKKKHDMRIYLLVLLGSVLTAVANVTYKYALSEIEFWNLFAMRSFCLFFVLAIGGLHTKLILEVKSFWWNTEARYLFILVEFVTAPIAMILMLAALAEGPVSMASTLFSTRPLFVLIMVGLLSTPYWNVLNEPLTKETMPTKLLFTTMIVLGVSGLTLF
jgi:drug/metabolite transporter (DMT)-like permease